MSVTPTQIVRHLKTYLPLFTDAFTEVLIVSAATMAGNILTVTSTAHGKTAGQSIVISGGLTHNPLTDALLDGATVIFQTAYEHDFTMPKLPDDPQTLVLGGFGSVWDGIHSIVGVPNRFDFTIGLPDGETLAPTLDGDQYLVDSLPFGLFSIDTVIDPDNFTVDFSAWPAQPDGSIFGLEIISGFRIAAAANFERAKAAYSEQAAGKAFCFVIMTDTDVSKDRHTLNDGVAGLTAQDERLLRLLQNFSTTVFLPTKTDLSGAGAQDIAYGTMMQALLSALFGSEMNNDSIIPYLCVPVGMGPGEYNSAYYVHVYDWQLPLVINYSDGFLQQPVVAFRDISQTLALLSDDQATMVSNINLDEEPLIGG